MVRLIAVCLLLVVSAGVGERPVREPGMADAVRVPESVPGRAGEVEGWGHVAPGRGAPPTVLEEFMIDTSITWVGAPEWQWSPSVAFEGGNYLVVWEDARNGRDYGVYGTRVDQAGRVLDPRGIMISDTVRDQRRPAVAFDGANYLVVWDDFRDGVSRDIYGARVSPAGDVLDPSGFTVSVRSGREGHPSVACYGETYLVVWEENLGPRETDVVGARVDAAGTVLDPEGIDICISSWTQRFPAVAAGDGEWLVVWHDRSREDSDIRASRVDNSGSVVDTSAIVVCSTGYLERRPTVGFDGQSYLVLWEHWWDSDDVDIYGARVDTEGAVVDTMALPVCTLQSCQYAPSMSFASGKYTLVWESLGWDEYWWSRSHDIQGAVFDPGNSTTEVFDACSARGRQGAPSVASGEMGCLVVWGDHRGLDGDIYGARVENTHLLDPEGLSVSTAYDRKWYPAAAFDGTNYLVVWQDYRNGTDYDVYGARVTGLGEVLDPSGFEICAGSLSQWFPRTAFDGSNYVVVWQGEVMPESSWYTESKVYASRVSPGGDVLDPEGIVVSPPSQSPYSYNVSYYPFVVFDGRQYGVAWFQFDYSGVYLSLLSPSGEVSEPVKVNVGTHGGFMTAPVVAFGRRNYLVVWDDGGAGWPKSYHIYGTRVSASGHVIDADLVIAEGHNQPVAPSVASDGENFLVVWEQLGNDLQKDIYGVRIAGRGGLLDTVSIPVCTLRGHQSAPSVVFDGEGYVVAFENWQDGTPAIYAVRVSASGDILDSVGIELVSKPFHRMGPSLTRGRDGDLLLVYDGVADYSHNAFRVFGRRIRMVSGCEPIEPWSVRSQGYWRRQCKDSHHEDICAQVDEIHRMTDLFDTYDCDSVCGLMRVSPPENDMCRKAKRQYMALLLNIASGKISLCNCLAGGKEVGEAVKEIDSLLVASPGHRECEFAKTLADNINNGRSVVPCDGTLAPGPCVKEVSVQITAEQGVCRGSTVIKYEVSVPGLVQLRIYDRMGRMVRLLANSRHEGGHHQVEWDGCDDYGLALPGGVYFCLARLSSSVDCAKIIRLR